MVKPMIIRKTIGNLAKNYLTRQKTLEFMSFKEILEYDVKVKEASTTEEVYQDMHTV